MVSEPVDHAKAPRSFEDPLKSPPKTFSRPDVGSWTPPLRGGQTATHFVRPGVPTPFVADSKVLLLVVPAAILLLRGIVAATGTGHSHQCHCGFHSVLEFISEPGKPDALQLG